jgi:hypothetical protein
VKSLGHPAKNDCSTEVLLDFCTRATFLWSVPVDKSIVGMGTFIDAKFQMNADSFGAYVKTELATTRGFDLLFHCFFPFVLDVEDEYTLLDDTKATLDTGDTEPTEAFSMGKDQAARQWRFVECCLLCLC